MTKRKGNAQDKLLMKICAEVDSAREIDLNGVIKKLELI